MQTRWFSNVPKDEQEDLKKLVLGSTKVLDKLKEICYNMCIVGNQPDTQDYDSPSWAYKQADRIGYLRALREIISLVDVSDHDTKRK